MNKKAWKEFFNDYELNYFKKNIVNFLKENKISTTTDLRNLKLVNQNKFRYFLNCCLEDIKKEINLKIKKGKGNLYLYIVE